MRCTSDGKQYVLRHRVGGHQRQRNLGPVERLANLAAARIKARAMLVRLHDGIDPTQGGDGTHGAVWQHCIDGLRSLWRTHLERAVGRPCPGPS